MQITLYRHAEPEVSGDEIISGAKFALWVKKYNAAGIKKFDWPENKLDFVFSSNLPRSYETAKVFGKVVKQHVILREAEVPLFSFPPIKLPAKYWLFLARFLWFCGMQKDCESFSAMQQRVKNIVDKIEEIPQESEQLIIVGHGFINRFIKKELIKRNWLIKTDNRKNKYLGKIVISKQL